MKSIVNIFEKMSYRGIHPGGFSVLYPFSLDHDFADVAKPIFLSESSVGALTFATHDFAGGETARALRFCFDDLHHCLSSSTFDPQRGNELSIRPKAAYGIPILHELNAPSEAVGERSQEINLAWLRTELSRHANLEERCDAAYCGHEYGVVYAVKFAESDLSSLEYSPSMRIKANHRIPRDQVVAKVRVPKTCRAYDAEDAYWDRAFFGDGLVGRLRSRVLE